MPQTRFGQTGIGRTMPVTRIVVHSKRGPVIPAFFTFNRSTLRFERWGTPTYPESIPYTIDNDTKLQKKRSRGASGVVPKTKHRQGTDPARVPTGPEWHTYNPSYEELISDENMGNPLSVAYEGSREREDDPFPDYDPDMFDWGGLGQAQGGGVNWPWWRPGGYHIYYSGNKLDDAMENPDPGKGNLGLRVGPFIGPTWDWNDSYGGRNELYLGCQIPQIGQRHGGIPEPYWDLAGRVGYRYNPPVGQMCGFAFGVGTYFQWTSDDDVNDQSNPWGQTLGPHHLDPYVEIVIDWDWGDYLGLPGEGLGVDYQISIELGYDGDIRGGVTAGF